MYSKILNVKLHPSLLGPVCFKGSTVHDDGSVVISPIWIK